MITQFLYTAKAEDIYNFYDFWYKQRRMTTVVYILALIWFIPTAYVNIADKKYTELAIYTACIIVAVAAILIFVKKRNKYNVKQMLKIDKTYLCKTRATVYENAIELETIVSEDEAQITEIYPYYMLNLAYETPEHFYLIFAGGETKVIPKESISPEQSEKLSKKISTTSAYKSISQEKK